MTKRVIGITGGAGSGKTEVLRILENEYGARIIIADEVARELSSPGGKSYEKIVEAFGPEILMEDKNIDRPKLSAIVFHQHRLLETLNNIVHPNVREEIERQIAQSELPLIVVEAALLIECGYRDICDEFWYVHSEEGIRRRRMKETRNYSDEKIDSIIRNQLSEEQFAKNCDKILENNSDLEHLRKEIEKLMDQH